MIRLSMLCAMGLAVVAQGQAPDEIVVVVNAAVATAPSEEDIKKIYLGRLRELDGKRAMPLDLEGTAPEREEFLRRLIGQSPMLFDRYWTSKSYADGSKPPKRHPANAVLAMVASEPGAVAYVRRSQLAGVQGVRVVEWGK